MIWRSIIEGNCLSLVQPVSVLKVIVDLLTFRTDAGQNVSYLLPTSDTVFIGTRTKSDSFSTNYFEQSKLTYIAPINFYLPVSLPTLIFVVSHKYIVDLFPWFKEHNRGLVAPLPAHVVRECPYSHVDILNHWLAANQHESWSSIYYPQVIQSSSI